ncbi:MAG: HNH endonuclease [Actinobacteria bacterium]|nr:HNH endonuclease [Actinomycetota bacterium]
MSSKHKAMSEALSRSGFIGLTRRSPRSLKEIEPANPFFSITMSYIQNQFGFPVFDQSVLGFASNSATVPCQIHARTAIDQARWSLDGRVVWQWAYEAMWTHASVSDTWEQTQEQYAMAAPSIALPPDWNERRRAVLVRDGYKCAICGWGLKKHGDVHHIVQRAHGGHHHWSNLVSLCPRCHRVLDGHKGMNRPGFCVDQRRRIVHSTKCRFASGPKVEEAPRGYRPCQKCRPFKGAKAYAEVAFNNRRMQQAPKILEHLRREHQPSSQLIQQVQMLTPEICVYRLKAPQGRKKIKKSNLEIITNTTVQPGQEGDAS